SVRWNELSGCTLDLLLIKQEHLNVRVIGSKFPAIHGTRFSDIRCECLFDCRQRGEVQNANKIRLASPRQRHHCALARLIPDDAWSFLASGTCTLKYCSSTGATRERQTPNSRTLL